MYIRSKLDMVFPSEQEKRCDEQWSNAAIIIVFVGVVVVAVCFMWPLPLYYTIDPVLSAAQNEAQQLELVRKQELLYTLTLVGMTLVVVGGFITAGLFTKTILVDECRRYRAGQDAEYRPGTSKSGSPTSTGKHRPGNSGGGGDGAEDSGVSGDDYKLMDADFLARGVVGGPQLQSYGAVGSASHGRSGQ